MKAEKLNGTAKDFLLYAQAQSAPGSNAPPSYVIGLERLNGILKEKTSLLSASETLWDITDAERLNALYHAVLTAQDEGREGRGFFAGTVSPSYYLKHFYSAAIRKLAEFQLVHARRDRMLEMAATATDAAHLASHLARIPLTASNLYWEDGIEVNSLTGRERLATIKVRENQYVFREMMLRNFDFKCCLCGLSVVETLRASHISGWAEDKANRLNPTNGLCLAATYDAAVDKHLISLDDDYRLILSPSLREYYSNKAFQEQFKALEGRRITMPSRFLPSQVFLAGHREKMWKAS